MPDNVNSGVAKGTVDYSARGACGAMRVDAVATEYLFRLHCDRSRLWPHGSSIVKVERNSKAFKI